MTYIKFRKKNIGAYSNIAITKHYKFFMTMNLQKFYEILRNLRKNKDVIMTKPDKGNGVVILDRKLYDNAIQKIISDILNSKSSMKTLP